MTAAAFNGGAYVLGAPTSPRALVRHADLLGAYADGTLGDDREAYLSHFAFGVEMQKYFATNRQSVAGYVGPCWARWIVLDIDRPNLDEALADTRRLVKFLDSRYPEFESTVPVFFSGGKGFHILVELAHNPTPAVGFQRVARTLAEALANRAGVRIDPSIYDVAHIIRLPNTRHPRTGLFKVYIGQDGLFEMDLRGILETAKRPWARDIPCIRKAPDRIAADWKDAERETAGAPRPAPPSAGTSAPSMRERRVSSWISCGSAWARANGIKRYSAVLPG